MAAKLTTAIPKLAKLLRVFCSPDATEGEWNNAYTLFAALLQEVDPDGHEITRRIEAPISEEEVKEKIKDEAKKIFEAGRAKGRAEEIESRNRGVTALASLGQLNTGDKGIHGYDWREIVGHCLANKHHIYNAWEVNFIESAAAQLTNPYYKLSAKQTPIVTRIFQQWFGSRI